MSSQYHIWIEKKKSSLKIYYRSVVDTNLPSKKLTETVLTRKKLHDNTEKECTCC